MSSLSNKQNHLQQWLQSINCLQAFNQNDILNGMLVYNIIKNISQAHGSILKQLSTSNSTLTRVSNWNILAEQLKKFNIILNQQNKNKIVNGNQDIIIQIVSQLKDYHLKKQQSSEVDISQIDPKKDVNDTKSLLEMLLILIMKNFHLSTKQSVALLSNQSKYLAHILTKGLKGQFKNIENFIIQMSKSTQKVVDFCKSNSQNVIFFLRSIKPALISKSQSISSLCMNFFNKYLLQYPIQQRLQIFETHLLITYLLIIKRHPQMQNQIIQSIFQIIPSEHQSHHSTHSANSKVKQKLAKNNLEKVKVFEKVWATFNSDTQKYSMTLAIIKTFGEKNKLQDYLKIQFFSKQVQKAIQAIKIQQHSLICVDIVISLNHFFPQIFSFSQDQAVQYHLKSQQISQTLVQNLKSIHSTSSMSIICFSNQLFTLLQQFGQEKHFIAPGIYKLLIQKFSQIQTFSIDHHINSQIFEMYLKNFLTIIDQFPSIPWNIILEIILNQKRQNNSQYSEIQLHFFFHLLSNQNMDIKYALIIYDTISRLFMQTYYLSDACIKIMVKILQNFIKQQPIIQQLTIKMIKICLAIHYTNLKKLSQKRKSLTGNNKLNNQDALLKIKNNSIQFFILKICSLHNEEINIKIQPLVAFSYIQIKDKPQFTKGFKQILNVIGKFSEIVEKYQKQIKRAQQQAKVARQKEKQQKEKQRNPISTSRLNNNNKDHSKSHNNKSRYMQENIDSSLRNQNSLNQSSLLPLQNRGQTVSLHNRSLNASYLGVTPSAQKGIQKYQKVYLEKIEKVDLQKIRKQQEQERFQQLKKIMKKKMMSHGIQIKGLTDQIQYLFQFDSQQNVILEKHFLKVPYYSNETQEDRDMKAVEKLLKSHQKSLKLIFTIFTGHKKGMIPQYFDQIAQKTSVINATALYKLLKDFQFQDYITSKQVQYLTQKVNIQLNPTTVDYQYLDFDGFVEFIKQVSFFMFTRPPKDLRGQPLSMMLEQTFSNFKLFAGQNLINEQMFEEPSNIFFNQTQAIAELNRKLIKNPDYILPQGYKKIVDKKISFQYGIFLEAMSPTYKVVFEVVDDLLFKALGVHVIQPFTKEEKITRARPSLFVAERIKLDVMPARHIPVKLKKQIAKIPITSRAEAKQCAIVLDQIIEAIQLGHTSIGQKHLNKTQLQRKKQQEQLQKQYYISNRKRENRNRQAKTAIEQYKDKKQQKQKQFSLKKQQEQRKIKQQKQKRERQDKQMKKKLEVYNQKRKEQQQEKMKKKKQQEERQKRQRQKLKMLNQQTKKKIQQEKKKKQEQQNTKKAETQKQQKTQKEAQKKKMQQSQVLKKKMVQDFKLRKSQVRDTNSLANKSMVRGQNTSSKKNLQSYQQGEDNIQ